MLIESLEKALARVLGPRKRARLRVRRQTGMASPGFPGLREVSVNRIAKMLIAGVVLMVVAYVIWRHVTYVTEHTDYSDPPERGELKLVDDELGDKNPAFDPDLVDSRPLGDWEVNKSAAVIKLDCPAVKPDKHPEMLLLRPSYADAVKAAEQHGLKLLPSANLLDGAGKQFDDGLYAALDLACFRGEFGLSSSAPGLVRSIFDKLPHASPARPFLAAALELAGRKVELKPGEAAKKDRTLAWFERDKARSKPISFYEWTGALREVWRFYRFLQHEFADEGGLDIPREIAAALKADADLLKRYRAVNGFYGRLTNPMICLPVDALIDAQEDLAELARKHGARRQAVAVFPPSTSRETELFDRLFPLGVPADANLMGELIRRIRSGEVDLEPGEDDGWYQYQVYALETMLLPSRGREADKLLLTANYKKRLVEAFKALITKRRETHVRQLAPSGKRGRARVQALAEGEVCPRLRLEPCPTCYLRTARAYAFLESFLLSVVPRERLAAMHGLKKGGERAANLADELAGMRRRFYGFYLVSCEDIGMRPEFLRDEPVDRDGARNAALAWLRDFPKDPDVACDTRVAVPVYVDPIRDRTRLWATLGVRLAHLEASYARPPKVRPKGQGGAWQDVDDWLLDVSRYVIAVDEFAEFETKGSAALTRAEHRAVCDRHKTRAAILKTLVSR